MNSYKFSNYDEAIVMLQKLKKEGKKGEIVIFTIDFENEEDTKKTVASLEYCCILIKESETIIINGDEYIPHIQLFTVPQKNIEKIVKRGLMHDIILGHSTE